MFYFFVEDRFFDRNGGIGGGTCGGGIGEEVFLKISVLLLEWFLERGL